LSCGAHAPHHRRVKARFARASSTAAGLSLIST
jgi:hypothetical protein